MNHRYGTRVRTPWTALIRMPDRVEAARVLDISLSGALLSAHLEPAGTALLWISLPADHRNQWRAAFLVRHCARGTGIEWAEDLDPRLLQPLLDSRCESSFPAQYSARDAARAPDRPTDGPGHLPEPEVGLRSELWAK